MKPNPFDFFRLAIAHDYAINNFTPLFKVLSETVIICVVTQPPNKEFAILFCFWIKGARLYPCLHGHHLCLH